MLSLLQLSVGFARVGSNPADVDRFCSPPLLGGRRYFLGVHCRVVAPLAEHLRGSLKASSLAGMELAPSCRCEMVLDLLYCMHSGGC